MKKAVACADLGMESCTFEARSEKENEIVDAMMDHVSRQHPELVKGKNDKQKADLEHQIHGAVKEPAFHE